MHEETCFNPTRLGATILVCLYPIRINAYLVDKRLNRVNFLQDEICETRGKLFCRKFL